MRWYNACLGGIVIACLGLTACASEGDELNEGASSSLSDVLAGIRGGNGNLVCARLHRDAQVTLAESKGTDTCIVAVSQGTFDQELVESASKLESYSMEMSDDVLALSGPGAEALASLLGVEDLWMSEFQGDWMIHTTDQLPDGAMIDTDQ